VNDARSRPPFGQIPVRWLEIEARQAGRRLQRPGDQGRAGRQALRALVEPAHYQIGWLQGREPYADRHIESFGVEVDAAVGAFGMNLDGLVFDHEEREIAAWRA
jgi:hypothetical protein